MNQIQNSLIKKENINKKYINGKITNIRRSNCVNKK